MLLDLMNDKVDVEGTVTDNPIISHRHHAGTNPPCLGDERCYMIGTVTVTATGTLINDGKIYSIDLQEIGVWTGL